MAWKLEEEYFQKTDSLKKRLVNIFFKASQEDNTDS